MKVSIDHSKCMMCGSCVAICPEVFEMKDDGSVDVKEEFKGVDLTDENLRTKVREAEGGCPGTAVTVEE